ncbi:MAG: nucleotide-binding protein [Chloroflexi bacterium]|nr:nucleotide-binding protein [Chloroflexota bacterium]
MARGPSRPYPAIAVEDAIKLPMAIYEHNAGRPINRVLLAEAMKWSPASTGYRDLITASSKYGFTEGNYHSEVIALTKLGEQLTRPRSEAEKLDAMRNGFRSIELFDQLLSYYNNNKLPVVDVLKGILKAEPFKVAPQWAEEAANIFIKTGWSVGFIRDVGGSTWVVLDAGHPTVQASPVEEITDEPTSAEVPAAKAEESRPPEASTRLQPPATLQFFVAHGRDTGALQQLEAILKELGIPYVVAKEEANAGRPIPQKVKELMGACSGGIFVFTADEEFRDTAGNVLLRPRENVIYELGAASYVYDRRIVVFKEKGVTFPSDFSDLGYIEFEKGQLSGKTMDLLRELIALKAIKLLPGS